MMAALRRGQHESQEDFKSTSGRSRASSGFPMVITVRAPFPANILAELIAAAKAKPGKINIGTPPIGSPQHAPESGALWR